VLVGSIFRWQEVLPLVIVYATEIAAINPSAARFALMEMFDFVPMRICIFGNVFTARNLHSSLSVSQSRCSVFNEFQPDA
jgi:hypothetical protein